MVVHPAVSAALSIVLAVQTPPESPAPAPPASPATSAAQTPPASPATSAAPAPPAAPVPGAAELNELYKPRLARAWLREAGMVLGSTGVAPDAFGVALHLANNAIKWLPDDEQAWRVAFEVARQSEAAPGGLELRRRAVSKLSKLDPSDEVIQLLRLSDAVNAHETAEERLAAYQRLLTPEVRAKLGARVASRLMFDQALLQNRMGNLDGFAASLADAIAIAPAFPAATELAAGFFAARTDDLGSVAELMVAAIVANPTKLDIYLDLGAILMAEGAYASAARIYRMAELVSAPLEVRIRCDVSADLALAQWGAGDPVAALRTVRLRIAQVDDDFLRFRRRLDPDMIVTDAETRESPITPMLALLQAVLARATNDPKADEAVARLRRGIDFTVSSLTKVRSEMKDTVVAGLADGLWACLLLGGEVERANKLLNELEGARKLLPEARKRYEGWLHFREGDLDKAIEELQPLAASDAMARLGLALALLAKEQTKAGAKELLAIAQEERGTALGLYAADQLHQLVKARPGPGPSAAALDAAIATLPAGFDRFLEESRTAITMTVTPEKLQYTAFEPIRFRVTIRNRSTLTLAIDPQGPIDPRSAVSIMLDIVGVQPSGLPISIVPIDRRIELAPGAAETITLDLSYMSYGSLIGFNAVRGMSIELRVVVNFIASLPRVQVGFMGTETTSEAVRVEGIRTDDAWQESLWTRLKATDALLDPAEFALAGAWLAGREELTNKMRMSELAEHWASMGGMFRQYPPVVQAWLIMAMPNTMVGDGALLDAARASGDPMVIEAFLLRRARSPDDAIFDIARRTGDPFLTELADGVQKAISRRLSEMQTEFGLGEKGEKSGKK